MGRILVLYHSNTGCVEKMAELIGQGAKTIPGHEIRVLSVDKAKATDVVWADGIACGTPTNLGGISYQMKRWWDEEFAPEYWDKVDGKFATVFSSQGGHGGGAEIACQAMSSVLLNFGFLTFGVTDYVSKIHTCHYGAVIAKAPRNDVDIQVCKRLGLRLAEWVAYFVDGRKSLHPLLTTKAAPHIPNEGHAKEPVKQYPDDLGRATRNPVHLVVVKKVEKSKQKEWIEMAEQLASATWREEGCLSYNFVRSGDTEDRFIITELWSSDEAVQAHFNQPHFLKFVPLMDAISETISIDKCKDALALGRPSFEEPKYIAPKPKKKVLIYTRALDYVHASLPAAAAFFSKTCMELDFEPIVSDDPALLEKPTAPEFDTIVLLSNSGEIFDTKNCILHDHIAKGKGILGVHACLASFLDGKDASGETTLGSTSTIIRDIFGTHFNQHPPPQVGKINVDKKLADSFGHGLETLPSSFEHEDEFFNYTVNPAKVPNLDVLLSVDESTYTGGKMGNIHPVVWRRTLGNSDARVFYSSLGHFSHSYNGLGPNDYIARIFRAGLKYVTK